MCGSANIELTTEAVSACRCPPLSSAPPGIGPYLSATNGELLYLATTVAVGTALVDLTALASGREASVRFEDPLPAGRLLLSNGRLCLVCGNTLRRHPVPSGLLPARRGIHPVPGAD